MQVSLRNLIQLGMTLCLFLSAAAAPHRIEDVLTADEFRRAGLDRLSVAELDFLNDQLEFARVPRQRTTTPAHTFGAELLPGTTVETEHALTVLRTRVLGVFSGWNGRTIFRLENGQVWRQTDNDRFSIRAIDPVVIVERGAMGAYYLRVDGLGSRVRVVRIH